MAKAKDLREDLDLFGEIRDHATQLVLDNSKRDVLYDELQALYDMDWLKDVPKSDSEDLKITKSPDAANSIEGGMRLMTATQPEFSMPWDVNDTAGKAVSDRMEKMAKIMWQASGKLAGRPVEKNLAISALLFSRCDIGIISTHDLVLEAGDDPVLVARAKRARAMTPYLYEAWSSRECYAERDRLGLLNHLRVYTSTVQGVRTDLGEEAVLEALGVEAKAWWPVAVWEWCDLYRRCVWLERAGTSTSKAMPSAEGPRGKPVILREHNLGFVPVVSRIIDGTTMFPEPEKQVRPFLYTLLKSGLADRQNLAMTALYTSIFAIAQNAMFVHGAPPGKPEKRVEADFARIGAGVIETEAGETFGPLFSKGAIDPALITGMELAERKATESTISRQALGEPMGAGTPYSTVALLHQAGRLPLVGPKTQMGEAIAEATEIAFRWIKTDKRGGKARYAGGEVTVRAGEIPDQFQFEVRVEVDLPQDKLQLQGAAAGLQGSRTVSKRYVREEMLGVGQSVEMDEEIWSEEVADLMLKVLAQSFIQAQQQKASQDAAAAGGGGDLQPGQAGGTGGGGGGGGGGEELPEGMSRRPDGSMAPTAPGSGAISPAATRPAPAPGQPGGEVA